MMTQVGQLAMVAGVLSFFSFCVVATILMVSRKAGIGMAEAMLFKLAMIAFIGLGLIAVALAVVEHRRTVDDHPPARTFGSRTPYLAQPIEASQMIKLRTH